MPLATYTSLLVIKILHEYLQNRAASDGQFSWPLGMEGIWINIRNDTNLK